MGVLTRDIHAIIPTLMGGAPMTNINTGTSTTYSAAIDVGTFAEILAFAIVNSHAGTPTLDISFDFSPDGRNWVASGDAFTQITTSDTTTFKRLTANFGRFIRVKAVVAGSTPSYNWSLVLMCKG